MMQGSDAFYKDGLRFSCQQCSHCCKDKPGVVYLSQEDLSRLSAWAQLTDEQFMKVYCRWIDQDDGSRKLSLRELSNYDCVFWQRGTGCQAYEARPVQCRTYPFWTCVMQSRETWDSTAKECPGINTGTLHSAQEVEAELARYEARRTITG